MQTLRQYTRLAEISSQWEQGLNSFQPLETGSPLVTGLDQVHSKEACMRKKVVLTHANYAYKAQFRRRTSHVPYQVHFRS